MPKSSDKFVLDIPCHLEKSDDGKWKIQGLASTAHRDAQGEIIDQKGLDISHLQERKGYFNEDHKPGIEHKIGKITKAIKTKRGLVVGGYLFKKSPKAAAFRDIMSSLQKGDEDSVKMSVEGKVIKRGANGLITQAKITGVALTLNPVNENTYVQFAKALNDHGITETNDNDFGVLEMGEHNKELESAIADFSSESTDPSSTVDSLTLDQIDAEYALVKKTKLVKALKLGKKAIIKSNNKEDDTNKAISTGDYNVPPGDLSQGPAMTKESLDETKKKMKKRVDNAKKKIKKSEEDRKKFTALFKKLRKSYPDLNIEKVMSLACVIYDDKGDKLFLNDEKVDV